MIVDILTFNEGRARSLQTTHVRALPFASLRDFGESYFHWLERIPTITVAHAPDGTRGLRAAGLPALHFLPPYLAAARGGRELRYPIVGGLLAADRLGRLSFGYRRDEGPQTRNPERGTPDERPRPVDDDTSSIVHHPSSTFEIWVDLAEYRSRLGAGRLYRLSQAFIHSRVTVSFVRAWVDRTASGLS